MKEVLKNIGVITITGWMASLGFITGMFILRPENITYDNTK